MSVSALVAASRFLALVSTILPLAINAQLPSKVATIGLLSPVSASAAMGHSEALRRGLEGPRPDNPRSVLLRADRVIE